MDDLGLPAWVQIVSNLGVAGVFIVFLLSERKAQTANIKDLLLEHKKELDKKDAEIIEQYEARVTLLKEVVTLVTDNKNVIAANTSAFGQVAELLKHVDLRGKGSS